MFQFNGQVRMFVSVLVNLLYYANAQSNGKWAQQSSDPNQQGVYGHAANTLKAILKEELGDEAEEVWEQFELGADEPHARAIERVVDQVRLDREMDKRERELEGSDFNSADIYHSF